MKKFSQYIDYINEAGIPNSNDRVTNLGSVTDQTAQDKNSDVKKQPITSLDQLFNRIDSVKKKMTDKKTGTAQSGTTIQQQQQQQPSVGQIRLVKDLNFKIKDNAYEYDFNYISADKNAIVPYYSFKTTNTKISEKSNFVYLPTAQFSKFTNTFNNLSKLATRFPDKFKDEFILSNIKANLSLLNNSKEKDIMLGQVRAGGLASEITPALDYLMKIIPNVITNKMTYADFKQLPNKVKSESNNIHVIYTKDKKPYRFNSLVKPKDTIMIAHFNSQTKKWVFIAKININSVEVNKDF
jgi:hypothetical protein